ncbi:MAG: cyclase family protein [Erysipelotrichaceae bacterium]|nr:cyclase family protein [Erysipelotrichaceae bacterium]
MTLHDLTLPISRDDLISPAGQEKLRINGHFGTHFDVMDKSFPIEYVEREAVIFDVPAVTDRDIDESDIDLSLVREGMFVGFATGFIEQAGYGCEQYRHEHPRISVSLMEKLVERGVSLIGLDFAGARRHGEHTPMDQYCADHGTFIIENLCNLKEVAGKKGTVYTFPLNCRGLSGLPCRVIMKTE